jgi:hypothetical protein
MSKQTFPRQSPTHRTANAFWRPAPKPVGRVKVSLVDGLIAGKGHVHPTIQTDIQSVSRYSEMERGVSSATVGCGNCMTLFFIPTMTVPLAWSGK